MNDQTTRLANQLKNNPAALQALMQSRDAQALMQLLTRGDQGAGLRQAAQAAAKGDTAQMMQLVEQLRQDPNGTALMQRIQQAIQKK